MAKPRFARSSLRWGFKSLPVYYLCSRSSFHLGGTFFFFYMSLMPSFTTCIFNPYSYMNTCIHIFAMSSFFSPFLLFFVWFGYTGVRDDLYLAVVGHTFLTKQKNVQVFTSLHRIFL